LSRPGSGVFYAQTLNGFTMQGQAPRRRWLSINAERARTGIDQLVIDENPNNASDIVLRDVRTELYDEYFGVVDVAIMIGTGATADRLTGTARLEERQVGSGNWRLDREP